MTIFRRLITLLKATHELLGSRAVWNSETPPSTCLLSQRLLKFRNGLLVWGLRVSGLGFRV